MTAASGPTGSSSRGSSTGTRSADPAGQATRTGPTSPAGGVDALYPFLYTNKTDISAILAEVRRSTEAKAAEVAALRESLVAQHGELLLACAGRLAEAFGDGGRLFAFGNGGSSTDAQDVAQLFLHPPVTGRPLPAISLTHDVAALTALSNDVGFEVVFARQVGAFARSGDIAIGLSTSGGSANVLSGFEEASRRGLVTVGLAGYDGGAMAELSKAGRLDYLFVVPSPSVHRIQEAQTTLYHVLWELIQQALTRRQAAPPQPA